MSDTQQERPPASLAVSQEPDEVPASEAIPAATEGRAEEPSADVEERAEAAARATADAEPQADAEPAGRSSGAVPIVDERLAPLARARDAREPVEGRVFGWNPGGFHVVVGDVPAFCPRSEMEVDGPGDPESYLDRTYRFRVLRIQGKGRRVVLSRAAVLREERDAARSATLKRLEAGAVVQGTVSSLAEFGAFIDLGGGIEGLVHVSEIGHRRVSDPAVALAVGQQVTVKVLRVEKRGKRISLSMKALQADPWHGVRDRYPEGSVVTGTVERTGKPGAFIELEPGLTGLLPVSEMGLPREAIPARIYPPGKEVKVQVMQVDARRRRIGLAPEGSAVEGSRHDYARYKEKEEAEAEGGFGALAAAFEKLRRK